MTKKTRLDEFEQEIEDNFESLTDIGGMKLEIGLFEKAAASHIAKSKSITLRIKEIDLEAMKIKASKLGIPYQTYINMLIRKDAASGF